MSRIILVLCCVVFLSTCTWQTPLRHPKATTEKLSQGGQTRTREGQTLTREGLWELLFELNLKQGDNRHDHVRAHLLLESYLFADGWRLLVLQKQLQPAYTLTSYYRGFFRKEYQTHVKMISAVENQQQSQQYYEKIISQWRRDYPQAQHQGRIHKHLLFFLESSVEKRFFLLLRPDGSHWPTDLAVNQVASRYQWSHPQESRVSFHPNIFRALVYASGMLKAEKDIPLHSLYRVLATLFNYLEGMLPATKIADITVPLDSSQQRANGRKIVTKNLKTIENTGFFTIEKYWTKRVFDDNNGIIQSHEVYLQAGARGSTLDFLLRLSQLHHK